LVALTSIWGSSRNPACPSCMTKARVHGATLAARRLNAKATPPRCCPTAGFLSQVGPVPAGTRRRQKSSTQALEGSYTPPPRRTHGLGAVGAARHAGAGQRQGLRGLVSQGHKRPLTRRRAQRSPSSPPVARRRIAARRPAR